MTTKYARNFKNVWLMFIQRNLYNEYGYILILSRTGMKFFSPKNLYQTLFFTDQSHYPTLFFTDQSHSVASTTY